MRWPCELDGRAAARWNGDRRASRDDDQGPLAVPVEARRSGQRGAVCGALTAGAAAPGAGVTAATRTSSLGSGNDRHAGSRNPRPAAVAHLDCEVFIPDQLHFVQHNTSGQPGSQPGPVRQPQRSRSSSTAVPSGCSWSKERTLTPLCRPRRKSNEISLSGGQKVCRTRLRRRRKTRRGQIVHKRWTLPRVSTRWY